jgi:hypothetical protein
MGELPPGKRGTVRLDPTATVPEAAPLRFADGDEALAAADREDLAREKAEAKPTSKPLQPASDRQEFTSQPFKPGPRGPTLELRKVDVTRADPRKMATVKGRGLTYDPSLDADEPGEPAEPSRSPVLIFAAIAIGLAVIALVGFIVKSRLGH